MSRKEAARVLGIHEKTVETWERAGAFRVVVQRGDRGKVRIGADADGVPLLSAGWSREGRAAPGAADRPELRKVDKELVLAGVRETAKVLAELPPFPDPAKEALARGEPESVVVARVEARGRVVQALVWVGGMALVMLVGLGLYGMASGKRLRFR